MTATRTEEFALAHGDADVGSETVDGAERALIERARAGDGGAFEHLVLRHERMVLRTALRLLGRLDIAQDAVQETFLRLHRHLGRVDVTRPLAPWLYRLVVNACHDISRRSARARLVPLDELDESRQPDTRRGAEEVERQLALDAKRRLVKAALVTLPEKERAALVLRDIEGLTTAEVARALGSSEGTVRSQISTARLKIRRFVEARRGGRP